jgi:hypothetical protein
MIDVIRLSIHGERFKSSASDIAAVENGEQRLVRCYLKPNHIQKRKHWIPGHLWVDESRILWRGSSSRWESHELKSGEWLLKIGRPHGDDRVYKNFSMLECTKSGETVTLAIPRGDVKLCEFVLLGN